MPEYPGFVGGSSPSLSMLATSERTMNYYIEQIGTEGRQHKTALYPTPGQSPWITAENSGGVLTDTGGRAGIAAGSRAFVIIGTGLYEPKMDGSITRNVTSLAQDQNPAEFAYLGTTANQLGMCSGGNAYVLNLSSLNLTQVLTGECHQIGMLDEYLLALNQNTGKLRISNLNDGLTWDVTQFAFRSAQPDPWVAMAVNAPDIWLLGANSGDIWYDAGTSPFPLAARTGLNIPYGIVAPFSLKVINGRVFWLTSNAEGAGIVVATEGYGPRPISTSELETAIAGYARNALITDAEGLSYYMLGHTFYVLRFPSANATWQFDLNTGKWTELGSWNSRRGDWDVWRARFHMYAFGKHIVGDASSGTLSFLDVIYNTESDGSIIRRMRQGPILINDMKRMPIGRFELGLEAGQGLQSGQGSDPVVMGQFSSDGGKTFGNERRALAGPVGQFRRQIYWNRHGSPRLWVPRVVMTDPIPWRIVNAYINNAQVVQ